MTAAAPELQRALARAGYDGATSEVLHPGQQRQEVIAWAIRRWAPHDAVRRAAAAAPCSVLCGPALRRCCRAPSRTTCTDARCVRAVGISGLLRERARTHTQRDRPTLFLFVGGLARRLLGGTKGVGDVWPLLSAAAASHGSCTDIGTTDQLLSAEEREAQRRRRIAV